MIGVESHHLCQRRARPPAQTEFAMRRLAILVSSSLLLAAIVIGTGTVASGTARDATPAAGAALQTLVALTYPAASVPAQAEVHLAVSNWNAGDTETWAVGPGGIGLDYVLTGAFTVRSAGTLVVTRAGGPPKTAPANADTDLAAGDGALYLDLSAASMQRADEPTTVLYVAMMSLATTSNLSASPVATVGTPGSDAIGNAARDDVAVLNETQWAALGGGPVTVVIAQATIAPGATLPAFVGPGYRLVGAPGRYYGQNGWLDGPLTNDGATSLIVYVLTLQPGFPSAETPPST
jgi:hypothetical protein